MTLPETLEKLNYPRLKARGLLEEKMLKHFVLNFGHCELVSTFLLILILIRNVFHDHLIRHCSRRHRKISSTPQMLTPKLLLQMLKLLQQLPRCLPLDVLRYLRYRQARRN